MYQPDAAAREIGELLGEEQSKHFYYYLGQGQRVGQAFVNALTVGQINALCGSLKDPFYADTYKEVWDAIEYLTAP